MEPLTSANTDRSLGRHVTVLTGERAGRYPHGNSLLVRGREETVLIDPSLSIVRRADRPRVDWVLNSHCHEDHVAGNHCYPDVPWHLPEADALAITSIDAFLALYGMSPATSAMWRVALVRDFHVTPRPDPTPFAPTARFDLGGVSIQVVALPGHTRGHSGFLIEPDGVLYLGDIDLSSFGPYYGDAWSSLDAFEATLMHVRTIETHAYATFHHIGVVEGVGAFRDRLDRFSGVIADRDGRLLEFLAVPRTMTEIVEHRFVYRPGDDVPFAADVERRSMKQHLDRAIARGAVAALEGGRFVAP